MTVRLVRAALLILGSVSVGWWLILLLSPWTLRVLVPGVVQRMSDVEQAAAAAPWAFGIPHFIAAGVAGLTLGFVTSRERTLPWVGGLVAVIVVWFYGPRLRQGSAVGGGVTTTIAQLLVAAAIAGACLGLGRRLQGHGPVA